MGDKHYIDFWKNVIWTLELRDDLTQENNFEENIKEYSEKINSILVLVSSNNYSWQVLTIDSKKFNFEADYFAHEFVNWAIMTWLNDIDKNMYSARSTVWLIMKSQDFSPIIWTTKDWSSIFIINWSVKSIFWDFFDKDIWIINNLCMELDKLWIYPSNFWKLHIWPVNEKILKTTYLEYLGLVKNISFKYSFLDFDSYFKPVTKEYWIINLNLLIDDILRSHGFSMYDIENTQKNKNSFCYNSELREKVEQNYIWTIAKII